MQKFCKLLVSAGSGYLAATTPLAVVGGSAIAVAATPAFLVASAAIGLVCGCMIVF